MSISADNKSPEGGLVVSEGFAVRPKILICYATDGRFKHRKIRGIFWFANDARMIPSPQ